MVGREAEGVIDDGIAVVVVVETFEKAIKVVRFSCHSFGSRSVRERQLH